MLYTKLSSEKMIPMIMKGSTLKWHNWIRKNECIHIIQISTTENILTMLSRGSERWIVLWIKSLYIRIAKTQQTAE